MGSSSTSRTRTTTMRSHLGSIDGPDVMFVAGILLLAVGLAWIWRPLGPISIGAVLVVFAWELEKPRPERPTRRLIATLSTEDGATDEELIG